MELILFFILLLQLSISLFVLKNIIHPIVILKAYCTLSSLVLVRFSEIWEINISPGTVLIFSSGLIFIDFGYFFFMSLIKEKKVSNNENEFLQQDFSVKFALFFTLYILACLLYMIFLRKDIIMFGNGFDSLSQSILMAKSAQRTGDIESLGAFQYALTSCTVIGITYVYICVYEKYKNGFNKRIIAFILPVIVTFILFYFTGRRAFLLNVIIVSSLLVYEFERRKNGKISLRQIRKLFLLLTTGAIVFYVFFITLGQAFGKAGDNTVAVYMSGGIVAFDAVYEQFSFSSQIFGQNMFRFFYKLLNIIPEVNFPTDTIKETIRVGNGLVTNVYTANLHYMADFGYFGVVIANIFIGFTYSYLYWKSKNEKDIGFWNVMISYFIINLIAYPGAEKFFVSFTVNAQYIIFFYIIFKSKMTIKNRRYKTNSKVLLDV